MMHKNLYKLFLKTVSLAFVLIIITFLITCKKIEREAKVITEVVSEITATSAKATGNIIDLGFGIIDHGHCWSLSTNPTITDSKTSLGAIAITGIFTSDLQNLEPRKAYHIRAYVKSGSNTVYSTDGSFTTSAIAVPTLTTTDVTSITSTTAVSGGNITDDGGGAIIARGVCWATTANPTISDSKTTDGIGIGSFTSNLSGLQPSTTYQIRAYATNSSGTAYGNEVIFTTSVVTLVVPTLTTISITNITKTTATSGGNITSDGGSSITVRGICWNTSASPTISNTKTSDGTGSGSFVSNLTGLTASTTYYVRAYATNSTGTAYGNEVIFTTSVVTPVVPTLTTISITNITQITATSGGNITSDGGASVSARGVCWSTSAGPTISNGKTSDGIGSGSFVSNISGLLPATTYYVRAYATNSAGTAYGNEVSFTTSPVVVATLTTTAATSITLTTAVSGGNITADGGGAISARGVCWATISNPTISDSKTTDGTGTGSFTSNLAGLLAGTTYYIRAYATNSAGTAYGNEVNFATPPADNTVYDIDGNVYNTVTIGAQMWMKENLKTTKFNDGTSIPNVTDNAIWAGLTSPAYCWYNNDAANYKVTYGGLYNWFTLDIASNGSKNVCPVGWHVPSDADWTTLTDYLTNNGFGYQGSGSDIAKSMAATSGWTTSGSAGSIGNDQASNNSSGFTALPGGSHNYIGQFNEMGRTGYMWSATERNTTQASTLVLPSEESLVIRAYGYKQAGNSVRCVKN